MGRIMNASAVTSITNFLLASEVFFFAGRLAQNPKARFSAAWFWSGMMLLLGSATLIGGIDHGFFQGSDLPRTCIQRLTWIFLGAMTFFLLMTIATQFFTRPVRRFFLIFGIAQFAGAAVAVLLIASYGVVILNYAPVMLLLLVLCLKDLKGNPGFRKLVAGILILFTASAIQRSSITAFAPLDQNGLYHLISMVGIVYLYLGGKNLRNTP
jgi:hypothetical protein